MMTDFEKQLAACRKEIDTLDDKILELISERCKVVEKVASLKRSHVKDRIFIRPGREATMLRRIIEKSSGEFPKGALAQIWRMLIAGSCNVEEKLKICCFSSGNDNYYWLAREYFGGFSGFSSQSTASRVVADVIAKKANIGVVPMPQDTDENWWASANENDKSWPCIFAKIPAVIAPDGRELSAFALGNVEPEETGNDKSIMSIMLAENVSRARLSTVFTKAGLNASMLSFTDYDERKGATSFLIEIDGFIYPASDKVKTMRNELGNSLISLCCLGSYSLQLKL